MIQKESAQCEMCETNPDLSFKQEEAAENVNMLEKTMLSRYQLHFRKCHSLITLIQT